MSQILNEKKGRTQRQGFWITVPCIICGTPFDKKQHPDKKPNHRRCCSTRCTSVNAENTKQRWYKNNLDKHVIYTRNSRERKRVEKDKINWRIDAVCKCKCGHDYQNHASKTDTWDYTQCLIDICECRGFKDA